MKIYKKTIRPNYLKTYRKSVLYYCIKIIIIQISRQILKIPIKQKISRQILKILIKQKTNRLMIYHNMKLFKKDKEK